MKLHLERPLVFVDLETTGIQICYSRIVEFSAIKLLPNGNEESKTMRLNPEEHIPEETTAVHGIKDEDVADKPTFKEVADELYAFLDNCDMAGFNSNKLDFPLLAEEFKRAGKRFDLVERKFIDVQNIFHKMEKRTLEAAYQFYCHKPLAQAHTAEADSRATLEVLEAQLDKYGDELQNDVDFLASFSRLNDSLDLSGRFARDAQGNEIVNFGKHKGKKLREVLVSEPGFYNWIMQGEFAQDTKQVLTKVWLDMKSGNH